MHILVSGVTYKIENDMEELKSEIRKHEIPTIN